MQDLAVLTGGQVGHHTLRLGDQLGRTIFNGYLKLSVAFSFRLPFYELVHCVFLIDSITDVSNDWCSSSAKNLDSNWRR